MPQHTETYSGSCRQSFGQGLPLIAAILTSIDRKLIVDIIPSIRVLNDNVHRIGIVSIECDSKAEFSRPAVLYIDAIINRVQSLVYATMVLLVQYIQICRLM